MFRIMLAFGSSILLCQTAAAQFVISRPGGAAGYIASGRGAYGWSSRQSVTNPGPRSVTWYSVTEGYSSAPQTGLPWRNSGGYHAPGRQPIAPSGGSIARYSRYPLRPETSAYARSRSRSTTPDRQEDVLIPAADRQREPAGRRPAPSRQQPKTAPEPPKPKST